MIPLIIFHITHGAPLKIPELRDTYYSAAFYTASTSPITNSLWLPLRNLRLRLWRKITEFSENSENLFSEKNVQSQFLVR